MNPGHYWCCWNSQKVVLELCDILPHDTAGCNVTTVVLLDLVKVLIGFINWLSYNLIICTGLLATLSIGDKYPYSAAQAFSARYHAFLLYTNISRYRGLTTFWDCVAVDTPYHEEVTTNSMRWC